MASLQEKPPHLGFDSWELAEGYNPELLHEQLSWILDNPARRQSAIEQMQPIQTFNSLLIAVDQDPETNKVYRSIQLNFYQNPRDRLGQPNNDDTLSERPHGHAKDALAVWYSPSTAAQVITRMNVLRSDEPPLPGSNMEQRLVVANCVQGVGGGKRPHYNPIVLGETAVGVLSRSWVTNGGMTYFSSTEVHSIGTDFKDNEHVAISVHYKDGVEPESYNTREGLMRYKRLTAKQADEVLKTREGVTGYLGPITMMYPKEKSFDIESMRTYPPNTDPLESERILEQGRLAVAELIR